MICDISMLKQICLSSWLVVFKYSFCIPRRIICISRDAHIDRQMKHNLTHMNKELHIPSYQVCEQEILEWVYILRERKVL